MNESSGIMFFSVVPATHVIPSVFFPPFTAHVVGTFDAIMAALSPWPNLAPATHRFVVAVHVRAFALNRKIVNDSQANPAIRVPLHVRLCLAHYAQRIDFKPLAQFFFPAILAWLGESVLVSRGFHEV